MPDQPEFNLNCPLPSSPTDLIQLGHGDGGQLTQNLLQQIIYPRFANPELDRAHDSALLQLPGNALAFTTDSYVVNPLVFPGGDIGKLAVYGTVNDLLMAGALTRYLSCSLIMEEGLPIATLTQIVDSMAAAAHETGVQVVTGDTKVVDKGHGDGLYINTAGIGERCTDRLIAPQSIRAGDQIILSADIGRHGLAIMAQREGLSFEPPLSSDCAALTGPVSALLAANIELHCLRDLTRGGLATALVELAENSALGIAVKQNNIAISDAVAGGCELLGLDPLYLANEGCFIAFVAKADTEIALQLLRQHAVSASSCIIGEVSDSNSGARLVTSIGSERQLRRMMGQPLPRIC
ncbi:MAG: hydrogenase expression/formation protein HypE [Gammaproteobacteria bacterium]|nr:hydrogenase expression/formation protein HypE [Gammaproteobacteria bacterium]